MMNADSDDTTPARRHDDAIMAPSYVRRGGVFAAVAADDAGGHGDGGDERPSPDTIEKVAPGFRSRRRLAARFQRSTSFS